MSALPNILQTLSTRQIFQIRKKEFQNDGLYWSLLALYAVIAEIRDLCVSRPGDVDSSVSRMK